RLIDHAIRPLFPKDFKDDTQIIVTILASDNEHSPILAGFLGVSAALSISGLPFKGPIVPLRISKIGENFEYGLKTESDESEMDLVVSYLENGEKIQALEAHADIVPEEVVVSAIKAGGQVVKPLFVFLEDFKTKLNIPLKKYEPSWLSKEIIEELKSSVLSVIEASKKEGLQYNDRGWGEKLDVLAKELEASKYQDKYSVSQIRIVIDEVQKNWVKEYCSKRKF
ncbi:Polyribonucleotide nucleotidyltransferase, partial [sediment metagenome]